MSASLDGTGTADPPSSPFDVDRNSADELDSVVLVTDTRSWIAIGVGLAAVLALLVWGFVGSIPERFSVGGVMTRPDAIVRVVAPGTGTVASVSVAAGSSIEAGAPLATITDSDGDTVKVTSTVDGIVQGIATGVGLEVAAGDIVATVLDESAKGGLSVVTYVESTEALELAGVDEVTVAPATVDQNTYGSLDGRVAFVADVPASSTAMIEQLNNEALATEFMNNTGGAPYLVIIEFDDPPQWTGEAPPFEIVAGTLAEVSAITSRERPIHTLFG